MGNYILKDTALEVIRSFINDLRPESTGLILAIYEAVLNIPGEENKDA